MFITALSVAVVSGSATYPFDAWSVPIAAGRCSTSSTPLKIKLVSKQGTSAIMSCAMSPDGIKSYNIPAGIFEIGVQFLVPEKVSLTGANPPNDKSNPTKSPNWESQTVFLATRGVSDYNMNYCHAKDMVTTRVGFVLSSYVVVRNLSYQGIDTIRPGDNGALCGGGAFETKGCAENDCKKSNVNNGGSDGNGSVHVTIDNVRLNDYYYEADKAKIGASVAGNYDCNNPSSSSGSTQTGCCFCKPNGVRASQIGVWVPEARNAEGTHDILISNVVSRSTQADGINLHANVNNVLVLDAYFENSGDDLFALWGASFNPGNITFKDSVGKSPGILRPNWYGNCVATYGLQSVVLVNLTCKAPTLAHPIIAPGGKFTRMDNTMFVFYTSFGGIYPSGNRIEIKGWAFEDLGGKSYTPNAGIMNTSVPGKMAWSKSDSDKGGIVAPYWFPTNSQVVNVYVTK